MLVRERRRRKRGGPRGVTTYLHTIVDPFVRTDRHVLTARGGDRFDIVLAADCVYEFLYGAESWRLLIETFAALVADDGVVLISLERRGDDGVDAFLQESDAAGFEIKRVCRPQLDPVELYEMRRRVHRP